MNTHEHNSNHDDSFATMVREAVAGEALPASDPTLREALLKRLDQPVAEPALKVSVADRRRTFFQRAGIALASTAALAIVGVIWQRPALERAVGLQPSSALHEERDLSHYLDSATKAESPASSAEGDAVQLGSGRFRSVYNPAVQQSNPGFQNDGSTVDSSGDTVSSSEVKAGWVDGNPIQDYRSTVAPRLKKRYGDSGPQMSSGPFGSQANGPAVPSSTVTGTAPPASRPAGPGLPAGLSSSSGSGGIAGGPASGKERTFSEQGQGPVNQLYVIPDPKQSGEGKPATPGEPGRKYNAPLDRRQSGTTVQLPPLGNTTTAPAKVPESKNGQAQPEGLVRDEKALKQRIAKLEEIQNTPEVRTKTEDEVAKRTKELSDLAERNLDFRFQEGKFDAKTPTFGGFDAGGETYAKIIENQFLNPLIVGQAQSTFAIDVDTASYANVRRFLTNGQLPPPDAVRLEELVNYFKYKYPQPKGDDPFSVNTEMADCPWQPGHKLLRVGLQGKDIHRQERPASNIVFLVDTSGSMTDENKLPLLRQAFTMLVGELNENDKVTIVTYAGNAGLRLPPTRGHEKETIIAAIDGMQSGGSTHGSAGISLAYEVAAAQFIKGGTNKVILATDGDLNVGITDDAALVELITKKAKTGVYLTVLGVGTGNLKDAKMERLADNGNGVYAYLDSVREARKVLVEEMSGSLVTIAKDVKIQVEFNPNHVQSYRLLGYENRVMANEDFRNDAKDAGEIGAGHSVTAMYEVVLVGADKKSPEAKLEAKPADEELEFQRVEAAKTVLTEAGKSDKLLTVRLRYKKPEATETDAAKELKFPVTDKGGSFNSASKEFQFASSVVAFGLTLRHSEYRGSANYSAVAEIATATLGEDVGGHRAEFVGLVKRAKTLRGE